MTKYFDLLRAHQQPADRKTAAAEQPSPQKIESSPADSLLDEEHPSTATTDASDVVLPDELPEEGEVTRAATSAPDSDASQSWLATCIQLTLAIFQAAEQGTPASIASLSAHIDTLLSRIHEEAQTVDILELDISRHAFQLDNTDASLGSLVQKSVMMMLYAIKVGLQLKLAREELLAQILAAMLHHIGMAKVPLAIRNKKEQLTDEELQLIRKAPEEAYNYLQGSGIGDAVILNAARQAQERYDGSGPQGLSGSDIAFSARLVSLLSMFEALIHYRPYRRRLLPRDAIRELVSQHKHAFDPVILKALIEAISLYPVGTYVQLNSGDIGLVIRVHQRLPLRPVIEIRYNDTLQAINSREIDLKGQPNLMVKRCMYEEGLDELRKEPGPNT